MGSDAMLRCIMGEFPAAALWSRRKQNYLGSQDELWTGVFLCFVKSLMAETLLN